MNYGRGGAIRSSAWVASSSATTGLYDMPAHRSRPGEVVLTSFADRRDRLKFAAAYADPNSGITTGPRPALWPVCVGQLTYTGHAAIQSDIANFKAALQAAGVEEGFMTSIAPGSASRIANRHYKTDEEFLFACADAMREEYKAIVDAGLVLQLDDPAIAENWDMVNPEPARRRLQEVLHDSRGSAQPRDSRATGGSDPVPSLLGQLARPAHDRHARCATSSRSCWPSSAARYSFEAANVRHEHEWRVWQDVKLPDGKLILPGIVSHATNVVEHPELVAERIVRFANVVGRERVIASTDCGLGGRVHPQIAWAKLEALAEGAALASRAALALGAISLRVPPGRRVARVRSPLPDGERARVRGRGRSAARRYAAGSQAAVRISPKERAILRHDRPASSLA